MFEIILTVVPFCAVVFVSLLITHIFPSIVTIPGYLYILLFLTAFSEWYLGNILSREHANAVARFRELVIILLLSYFFLSLPGLNSFPHNFYPTRHKILFLFLIILQWYFSFILHNCFREHENLLKIMGSRSGNSLRSKLKEIGGITSEVLATIIRTRRMFLFFIALIFFSLTLIWILDAAVNGLLLFCAVLTLLTSFLGILYFNMLKEDIWIYGYGLRVLQPIRRKRVRTGLFFLFFLLPAALLLASDFSLLPMALLKGMLLFLFSLLLKLDKDLEIDIPELLTEEPREKHNPSSFEMEQNLDLGWILDVLQYSLKIIVILGILYFLLKPFLSGTWRYYRDKVHPLRFLKGLYARIAIFFRLFFNNTSPAGSKIIDMQKVPEKERAMTANLTVQKQRERNRVLALFLKLLKWGNHRGFKTHGKAPRECMLFFSEHLPLPATKFLRTAELFEISMFSYRKLTAQEFKEYKSLCKEILRLNKAQQS